MANGILQKGKWKVEKVVADFLPLANIESRTRGTWKKYEISSSVVAVVALLVSL